MLRTALTRAPPYLQKTHHTSMHNALWATLIAMVVFAMFTLLSGYLLCDSKVGVLVMGAVLVTLG